MRHQKLRSCGGIFRSTPIFIAPQRIFSMHGSSEETKYSFRDFRWIAGRQNKCAMIDPPLLSLSLSLSRSMLIMKADGTEGRRE